MNYTFSFVIPFFFSLTVRLDISIQFLSTTKTFRSGEKTAEHVAIKQPEKTKREIEMIKVVKVYYIYFTVGSSH